MRFPNAFEGVKKLYTSQILNIIASILTFISAVTLLIAGASAVGASSEAELSDGTILGLAGGFSFGAILLLGALVLSVIAFIMMLIGLNKAKVDEPYFNYAFILVFVSLFCSILGGFIPGVFGTIITDIGLVCNVVVTVFIILAIRNLAIQLNDSVIEQKSKTLLYILTVAYGLAAVASIIASFINNNTAKTIAGVLALVSSILEIVATILFIIFLSKSKKMLEA